MELSELQQIRKHLHAHPELSGKEFSTQEYLKDLLSTLNFSKLIEVGGTGLAVFFKGTEPGPKLMFRTEIDALPIQEKNHFDHKSKTNGISHKCGHDGHCSIMIGLSDYLSAVQNFKGEICLLFQPAEETGKGAELVLNDENFDFEPDFVFALHNLPGFEKGKIISRTGSFTASVQSLILRFEGSTSHASEPEKGVNPGLCIAEMISFSNSLNFQEIHSDEFALLTLVHSVLGEKAYGVSAGYGELHFTLRSWSNVKTEELTAKIISKAKDLCNLYRLKFNFEILEKFEATINSQEAFDFVKKAANNLGLTFEEIETPFRFGEDFGLFTNKFQGAMFGLGAGISTPALHAEDYDYPDEITSVGLNLFKEIVKITQS